MRILIILAILLAVVVTSALLFFGDAILGERANLDAAGVDTFLVRDGMYAYAVAESLHVAGLIDNSDGFVWFLRLRGKAEAIKSGTYFLERSASSADLAMILIEGRIATTEVTFPEGWTAEQMAARLQAAGITDSTGFVATVRSETFTAKLGYGELPSLDGLLFPETYVFPLNAKPERVVSEMVEHFFERLGGQWLADARADKYGLLGVITLASIVEGEINLESEAGDVAAVYRNRLNRGMKLEADPTVQFLLPNGPKRLLLTDLKIDSPYNTYLYRGLPPGPINNPGEAALRAAVKPPEAPWLFMVARGDGGHTFTRTYEEHLKAKEKFDEVRRVVARQQRLNSQ